MFNWIGGLRPPSPEQRPDDTFIDPPETPAPVFAVRAFKHAIWGTPGFPSDQTDSLGNSNPAGTSDEDEERYERRDNVRSLPAEDRASSPSKKNGILMTPGTINGRRKQVSFRASVIDKEPKKSEVTKSGLPVNFPGKFPSPWTPKVVPAAVNELDGDYEVIHSQGNKVPQIVVRSDEDEEENAKPLPHMSRLMMTGQKRMLEDKDVTLDLSQPRSESGRYWKTTYEHYSERSEEETKVLISKARLARDFAKKKDDEVLELRVALDAEKRKVEKEKRKRHERERSFEHEAQDLREALRVALAENAKNVVELASLRKQLDELASSPPNRARSRSASRSDSIASRRGPEPMMDFPAGAASILPKRMSQHDESFNSADLLPSTGLDLWSQAAGPIEVETKEDGGNHIVSQMAGSGTLQERRQQNRISRQIHKAASASVLTRQNSSSSSEIASRPRSTSLSKRSVSPDMSKLFKDFDSTPLSPILASPRSVLHSPSHEGLRSPLQPSMLRSLSPLRNLSPNVALKRGKANDWAHVLDAKNSSRMDRSIADVWDGDEHFDPGAPIEALLAQASQSVTPLASREKSRSGRRDSDETASNSTAQPPPSIVSPASSVTSTSVKDAATSPPLKDHEKLLRAVMPPLPPPRTTSIAAPTSPNQLQTQTRSSRETLSQKTVQELSPTNKENVESQRANMGRPKSGVLIDPERMAAARARIAARKAKQGVLGVLRG